MQQRAFLAVVILCAFSWTPSLAQERRGGAIRGPVTDQQRAAAQGGQRARGGDQDSPQPGEPALRALVATIQQGINSGDIQSFSGNFARQIYITLRGKEGGYFSSNQAFYILQNYLSGRRALGFRFTTISTGGPTPYATGGGTFMTKGNPEILQFYVAFSVSGARWIITQLNVY